MTLNVLQRKEKEQAAPVRETEKTWKTERQRERETTDRGHTDICIAFSYNLS